MCRYVVISIETTGVSPHLGHRVVAVDAVEMIGPSITGRAFCALINPRVAISPMASALHGICDKDVETALPFEQFAEPLLSFIGDSMIVVRDAAFDLLFLDDELERCGLSAINRDRIHDMKTIFWTDLSSMPSDLRDRWLLAQPDMLRPIQRPPWYRALIAARMFSAWSSGGAGHSDLREPATMPEPENLPTSDMAAREDVRSWWPEFTIDDFMLAKPQDAIPPDAETLAGASFTFCWMGYFGQSVQRRVAETPLFKDADGRDFVSLLSASVFHDDVREVFESAPSVALAERRIGEWTLRDRVGAAFQRASAVLFVNPLGDGQENEAIGHLVNFCLHCKGSADLFLFTPEIEPMQAGVIRIKQVFHGVVHSMNIASERYPYRSIIKRSTLSRGRTLETPLDVWRGRRGWISNLVAVAGSADIRRAFHETRIGLQHEGDFSAIHIGFIRTERPDEDLVQRVMRLVSELTDADMLVTHSPTIGPEEHPHIELGCFIDFQQIEW